jgi:hypothetical protein
MAERKNFALRLNPELYAALERWAADDLRSVNAQIEYLLGDAARKAGRLRAKTEASALSGPDPTGVSVPDPTDAPD